MTFIRFSRGVGVVERDKKRVQKGSLEPPDITEADTG